MIASRAREGRGGDITFDEQPSNLPLVPILSKMKRGKKNKQGYEKTGREFYSGTGGRLSFFREEASRWIEGETKEQRREMSEIRSPFLLENA